MNRAELIEGLMKIGPAYKNKRKLLSLLTTPALRDVWRESVGSITRRGAAPDKSRKSRKSRKSEGIAGRRSRKGKSPRTVGRELLAGGSSRRLRLTTAAAVMAAISAGRAKARWSAVRGGAMVVLAPWRRPGGDVDGILLRIPAPGPARDEALLAALQTANEEHLSPADTSYVFLVS